MRTLMRMGEGMIPVMVFATGLLVFGVAGCRQKEVKPDRVPAASKEIAVPADEPADEESWVGMDGLEEGRWQPIAGAAELEWLPEARSLRIGIGHDLNGVRWSGPLPEVPYVLELEARRLSGSDFFCGLTFPVRNGSESVTLIVGGWGGNLVGISSIDGMDASENSTASMKSFEDQRWYRIRVEVDGEHLQAWIDDDQVVDAHTEGQRLSLREGPIEECAPLGLATWLTSAEVRGARWRKLAE